MDKGLVSDPSSAPRVGEIRGRGKGRGGFRGSQDQARFGDVRENMLTDGCNLR